MAVRIQFRRGTAAEWAAANPTLGAGEAGYETDTAKFKLGTGNTVWNSLAYAGVNQSDIEDAVAAVIDGAPAALDTLNELAAALGQDENFANTIITLIGDHTSATTNIHGIADTALLVRQAAFDSLSNNFTSLNDTLAAHTDATTNVHGIANTALLVTQSELMNHINATTNVHGISDTALLVNQSDLDTAVETLDSNKAPKADPTFTGIVVLPTTTSIGDVSATEISFLNNVSSAIQTQIDAKADINNAEFTGTVTLPADTSIGNVIAAEIGHLDGVTSGIQVQLDGKLETSIAATTYAALAGATFTGNVVLTANTSIGTVDSTEIGHLNGVTSNVQTQIDSKAPTANPTFTGTVAGVTKVHVGLGNVDNTADANKPVSTATQTALDAKASLAGAVFTGNVEVDGNLVVDGDFTVNGTNFNASATSIVIEDNIVQLAHSNPANTVDLGLVVAYNDGAAKHSGFVRDVSANTWKLFQGVTDEPTTTVNFAQGALDDLAVNNVTAAGVVFTDGTQTKQGVPSITVITPRTASYTLANLDERDTIIEISNTSATTLTIPTDATVNYPIGTTLDIIQTNTGQVTLAGAGGVTVNATPGLKLRTRWSSVTLLKRGANSWLAFGDLTA